ncbi:hypothetical protein MSG28_003451 [Choristoneura fumiferana]|uniref:Uncharacterized protein n=1 Tax=Choristoneura fumiferana TaxID=7141 RepID=A0ACC0KEU7_CHOFU|nr:hypothetical protein MSG28_003451 [Choristoneura fumiferana]
MLASIKKAFKWKPLTKSTEEKKRQNSLILAAFVGVLEDVLFWKKMWLSLVFVFILNIIYFVCLHFNVNFVEFTIYLLTVIVAIDALEAWLKHKHRTACLKKLANHNGAKLSAAVAHFQEWIKMRWNGYIDLRETNHTKAFLLVNILLGIVFLVGKCLSGYKLIYIVLMITCLTYKISKPIIKLARTIHQNAESDGELEGLIPEVSDVDIKILSIESETKQVFDEKQSLVQQKQLQSTLEEVQPAATWGGAAYNAFFNIAGAVSNMVYTVPDDKKRKRVSSVDSSDGFEMIDKNDLN